jgi:isocitrate/isopropylmalate dehydrogenase
MLDWLGKERKGMAFDGAVAAVIAEGSVRTCDRGESSTFDMVQAVTERYKEMIGT